jgi:hypothetical protein
MSMVGTTDVYGRHHRCLWLAPQMSTVGTRDVYGCHHRCLWLSPQMSMVGTTDVYGCHHWCLWLSPQMSMVGTTDVYGWHHRYLWLALYLERRQRSRKSVRVTQTGMHRQKKGNRQAGQIGSRKNSTIAQTHRYIVRVARFFLVQHMYQNGQ